MSAATFLLILTVVVLVFVAYVIKSWAALGNAARHRLRKKTGKSDRKRKPENQ